MAKKISELDPLQAELSGDELMEVAIEGVGNFKGTVRELNAFQFKKQQDEPTRQVVLNHNLGKIPSIRICNPMGKEVEAEIAHSEDLNTSYVDFSTDFTGLITAN